MERKDLASDGRAMPVRKKAWSLGFLTKEATCGSFVIIGSWHSYAFAIWRYDLGSLFFIYEDSLVLSTAA